MAKQFRLIGSDRREHLSDTPGQLGGNRDGLYGRLDCPAALSALRRGDTYRRKRVFFADEATAIKAGYRPCGRCMPGRYQAWKAARGRAVLAAVCVLVATIAASVAMAQTPPSADEVARYTGLHAAAAKGDVAGVRALLAGGADANVKDAHGRTPLHVAAHLSQQEAVRGLVGGGADPRALESQRYDVVTIAAVKNDVSMLKLALELGADPKAVTSPYDGTALIAAAHLGHDEVVRMLINAGAPLDHVNNLGWTALIEAIVLGDGGARHTACLKALLDAGANPDLPDRQGQTPLVLARGRGFTQMAALLQAAGGR